MARFFSLSPRILPLLAAGSLLSGFPALLAVAAPAAPAPANPAPPTATPGAPTATNKPGAAATANKPGAPAPPPDTFNRYGKILQPGVEPAHPLRLALPFPDVGEIKVPTQDELTMREKLEQLAVLTDDQIREQLAQWPPFTKMTLKDEGLMLARIQDFRDRRAKLAQKAAHDIGLLTLTPEQETRFEQEYWNKRLPMERDLAKQFEPILKQRERQLDEALYREFSEPNGPLTQPPKPPAPAKPAPPLAGTPATPPAPAPTQTAQAAMNPSTTPAH